jgi:hypothetical protein
MMTRTDKIQRLPTKKEKETEKQMGKLFTECFEDEIYKRLEFWREVDDKEAWK